MSFWENYKMIALMLIRLWVAIYMALSILFRVPRREKMDPILKVFRVIDHYKELGKSNSWIQSRIIGCLSHYKLFEAIQKRTGECTDKPLLQIIKEVGDY